MDYEEKKRRYISFFGSYCKKCPWFTSLIRNIFKKAREVFEEYGLNRYIEDEIDVGKFLHALEILGNLGVRSGCKAEIKQKPEEDRCKIRQCAYYRGVQLCVECDNFPCDLLKSHPGVIKFGYIDNLLEIKEKGLKWLDKQWL